MTWTFTSRLAALAAGALALALPSLAQPAAKTGPQADRYSDRDAAVVILDELFGGASDRRHTNDRDWRNNRRGGALVLFEHPNFRGARLPVRGEIRHLRGTGFNDQVSSIRVRSGAWLVCTDPDFRGTCRVFDGDRSAFHHRGLNDRISSVRPLTAREARRYAARNGADDFGFGRDRDRRFGNHDDRRGFGDRDDDRRGFGVSARNAGVIVYADPNGRGRSLAINGAIRDLHPAGMNDTISSIEIRAGSWEVCSDPNYRGRCRVISNSIGYTRDIHLNDSISSIRPVDGRRGRNW